MNPPQPHTPSALRPIRPRRGRCRLCRTKSCPTKPCRPTFAPPAPPRPSSSSLPQDRPAYTARGSFPPSRDPALRRLPCCGRFPSIHHICLGRSSDLLAGRARLPNLPRLCLRIPRFQICDSSQRFARVFSARLPENRAMQTRARCCCIRLQRPPDCQSRRRVGGPPDISSAPVPRRPLAPTLLPESEPPRRHVIGRPRKNRFAALPRQRQSLP